MKVELKVEGQTERAWLGKNPSPATFPVEKNMFPLDHQWQTSQATEPLIINTYNTGTGKTKAALLRLLERAREIGFDALNQEEHNALLIAPTNELIAQHATDAETFCQQNNLPYRVVTLTRGDLDGYRRTPGFSEKLLRRGATLHFILQDACKIKGDLENKATLFIVNPDIFYYALYFLYGKYDQIPLFQDIFSLCNYIVIDELHYYNAKQLANFLFFITLSKHYGYLESGLNRQFCLLTATPSAAVQIYLEQLHLQIAWITPERATRQGTSPTRDVPALSTIKLEIYSSAHLRDGLLTLVQNKRAEIKQWLDKGLDGAIISSALWRIDLIFAELRSLLSPDDLGRITGPIDKYERALARFKRLILATPTVDIGYNFERQGKLRQNLDFLFFDAHSADEFLQRLGRAGRILSKSVLDQESHILVVVDPAFYQALLPLNGQTLTRTALRELVEQHLPVRNTLFSYIQTGAIVEAFLPLAKLHRMASKRQERGEVHDLRTLFDEICQVFSTEAHFTYDTLLALTRKYIEQENDYNQLTTVPARMEERFIACQQRLTREQTWREDHQQALWASYAEVDAWLREDLREYCISKARFSFRDDFQAPLALVRDPHHWLSGKLVKSFDLLHIIKNFRLKYFETLEDWQQGSFPLPEGAEDALIYVELLAPLEPPKRLRIHLALSERQLRQRDWEQQGIVNRATALYGLEVVANKSLPLPVWGMLRERYIPAFIVAKESREAASLLALQRLSQFLPYTLEVTFQNGRTGTYYAVLGTMALLVASEMKKQKSS